MAWLYILIASILEVGWAIGLKLSTSLAHWAGTIILIVGSFIFLILAAKKMKPSYAYVVFGTVGTFLFDILFMGKSVNILSIIAIVIIVIGVVRLKQIGE
jgi:multidrug transporter EmrE-like cation transporter